MLWTVFNTVFLIKPSIFYPNFRISLNNPSNDASVQTCMPKFDAGVFGRRILRPSVSRRMIWHRVFWKCAILHQSLNSFFSCHRDVSLFYGSKYPECNPSDTSQPVWWEVLCDLFFCRTFGIGSAYSNKKKTFLCTDTRICRLKKIEKKITRSHRYIFNYKTAMAHRLFNKH